MVNYEDEISISPQIFQVKKPSLIFGLKEQEVSV